MNFMRVLILLLCFSFFSFAQKETDQLAYKNDPILVFSRPQESEDDWPADLRLYKNGTFDYFSMPYNSCWVLMKFSGRWELAQDSLVLKRSFDVVFGERMEYDEMYYKIKVNKLEVIEGNNELFKTSMEPILVCKEAIYERLGSLKK